MTIRVLFVDDEELILKTINRTLRNSDIEIFLANSAEEGLAIMQNSPIDIVVSDMRMPMVDGVAFLTEVKRFYPRAYRLILSGYVDREVVLKSIVLGVAFEYLTKPWDKDVFRSKIEGVVEFVKGVKNVEFVESINSITHLPYDQDIVGKLNKAIEDEVSFEEINSLIEKDLSLKTKLLQVVNSAVYTQNRISSVSKATTSLGIFDIKKLILDVNDLDKEFNQWQKEQIRFIREESRSVCKVFSILYKNKFNETVPENYQFIGNAYNIGKVVSISCLSKRYEKIIHKTVLEDLSFEEAEIALGYGNETFKMIGAYFLELWNFSTLNIEASLYHGNYAEASEENQEVLKLLNQAIIEVRGGKL